MNRRSRWEGSGRWWRTVALSGLLAVFMVCGPARPAFAADSCNTAVVDTTPQHVLANDSAVVKAMEQLEAKGADVRVRIFPATPDGSLDAYENAEVAACPSWSLGGQVKPNLLVFLVALDHNDAIYYGQAYGSRLQGKADQIRADMGSDFRAGDFAAGIAKAEQETYTALFTSGSTASSDSIGVSGEIIGSGILVLGAVLIIVVFRAIWRRIRTGHWGSGRASGRFSRWFSGWGRGDGNRGFSSWSDSGGGFWDSGGGDSSGGGDAGGSSGHW